MYICEINEKSIDEHSFAVMIVPVPSFPDDKKIDEIVRIPLVAVIGAKFNSGYGWSFVELSIDEKHCIGDELFKKHVEIEKWYWCNLYEHLRHDES